MIQPKTITDTLHLTPEQYFAIQERVEVKLEYDNGRIVPKEGSDPLPEWVIAELLKDDFDENILNFEFLMATNNHGIITGNLHTRLSLILLDQPYRIYSQSPNVYISLTGKYRIPDVTVAPEKQQQILKGESLTNPLVIFEVLSPATAAKDHNQKLEEYLHIDSLQSYFLVAQDQIKIEGYYRQNDNQWTYQIFRENALPIPAIGIDISITDLYKDVF